MTELKNSKFENADSLKTFRTKSNQSCTQSFNDLVARVHWFEKYFVNVTAKAL